MVSTPKVKYCKLQDSNGIFERRIQLSAALELAAKGDAYCTGSVNAAVPIFRRRERNAEMGTKPNSPTHLTNADTHALLRLNDGKPTHLSRKRVNALIGETRAERLIGYCVFADPDKQKTA